MSIITALISLLLSTSLYPAAIPHRSYDGANASAAAVPASEIKRAAAVSHESHGVAEAYEHDERPFDVEIDTKVLQAQRTPPTKAELDAALERAQEMKTRIAILNELAQPYAGKDPHVFAFELFQRWYELCKSRGFLVSNNIHAKELFSGARLLREISDLGKGDLEKMLPIAWCCLGIARAHAVRYDPNLDDQHYRVLENYVRQNTSLTSEAWRARRLYYLTDYDRIESASTLYRNAQEQIPDVIAEVAESTRLLPVLLPIIESYARQERRSVTDAVSDIRGSRAAGELVFDMQMIGSLEGLRNLGGKVSLSFDFNLITCIGSRDLPEVSALKDLSFIGNPLASIAPNVFAQQTCLTNLNLYGCALTEVSRSMFAGLVNLVHLYLRLNRISRIEDGAISQLTALTSLSLAENDLSVVPDDLQPAVSRGKLTKLEIFLNPLEYNAVEKEKLGKLLALVASNRTEADKKKEQQQ